MIKKYNLEGQDLVDQDISKVKGIKFLQRNLSMVAGGHIRHDPNLVAASVIELICDDLKYQDKQNDPQYLMLNNKLREEKRINKIKKAMKKKQEKAQSEKQDKGKHIKPLGSKSKFSDKYSDRIASIRRADKKIKMQELKDPFTWETSQVNARAYAATQKLKKKKQKARRSKSRGAKRMQKTS